MTKDRIKVFVSSYPWHPAKTYSQFAPHEYYVRGELDEDGEREFVEFVEFIRDKGFSCLFEGSPYTYYEFEGKYYWTMGEPIEETTILNRCNASDYSIENGEMRYIVIDDLIVDDFGASVAKEVREVKSIESKKEDETEAEKLES